MIELLLSKLDYLPKDESPYVWKSLKDTKRLRNWRKDANSGFFRAGYEIAYTPKPGYSAQNIMYEGIYD